MVSTCVLLIKHLTPNLNLTMTLNPDLNRNPEPHTPNLSLSRCRRVPVTVATVYRDDLEVQVLLEFCALFLVNAPVCFFTTRTCTTLCLLYTLSHRHETIDC